MSSSHETVLLSLSSNHCQSSGACFCMSDSIKTKGSTPRTLCPLASRQSMISGILEFLVSGTFSLNVKPKTPIFRGRVVLLGPSETGINYS